MSKLGRKLQKLFGITAGANNMATEFGSLAAATPSRTTGALADVEDIQSLSEWEEGWISAVLGLNALAIEDLNSLHFSENYQLAYIFQAGIPEWNSETTYYVGSLVTEVTGPLSIYQSKMNDNTGNSVLDGSNWQVIASGGAQVSTSASASAQYVMNGQESIVLANADTGPLEIVLPDLGDVGMGQEYAVKAVNVNDAVTVNAFGAQTIDGSLTQVLQAAVSGGGSIYMPTIKVKKTDATNWSIV